MRVDGHEAVPAARRAVTSALRDAGLVAVVDEAELVVSELVGNALLHAGAPVDLDVVVRDGVARICVADGSSAAPAPPSRDPGGLTGRGLALVDAVATRWGVDPTPGGKVVWAELAEQAPEPDEGDRPTLDELRAVSVPARAGGAPRYEVTLGDVPTDLLLAAKAHVDSVVRELTLSEHGAETGVSAALPPHLRDLVRGVVHEFAEARHSIKLQALAASAEGEPRTTLTLVLPAEAVGAGERYLAALQAADSHARAARLLTLSAPPQHQAFRRWYVTSLVEGLRRAAAGLPVVPPPSFETFLLGEVDALDELQRVSTRSARLQRVTAALAGALERERVAATALDEAIAEMGAARGSLLLLDEHVPDDAGAPDHGALDDAARGERSLRGAVRVFGSPVPVADARPLHLEDVVPDGTAVWAESRDERDARFPGLARREPDALALCTVPLHVGGHLVGALRLVFAESRLIDADERAFLTALAAVAAQAFERADLYETQAATAERLSRLQSLTAALSAATSPEDVLDVVVAHAQDLLGARRASVFLLGDDGRTVTLARLAPRGSIDVDRWRTFDVEDDVPVSEVLRTGRPLVTRSLAERRARWPALGTAGADVEHVLVVLPLRGEGRAAAALALVFAEDDGTPEPAGSFLAAFADACGQALERARSARRAEQARARLTFLARVTAELADTLDVERSLAGVARLMVPEIADWAVVTLLVAGELQPVAVEHLDPEQQALARELQRRHPSRITDGDGVGAVVRTGVPQLLADIPDSALEGDPPRDPEHVAALRRLGLRSALLVPLAARGRVHGALTLVTAESGRRYDEGDLAFVVDLAGRIAVAVDNARLVAASAERAVAVGFDGLRTSTRSAATDGDLPRDGGDDVALAAAEVGRFDLDLAAHVLHADERLAGFFGFSAEDRALHLDAFLARIHPDDRARVQDAIADAVDRVGDYDVEHRVVLPGGELRWLAVRGGVVAGPDGAAARLAGVAHDTTRTRDRGDQLARVLETMTDAFVRLDRAWRFTYVNAQAERLLFRRREELVGRNIWAEYRDAVGTSFSESYERAARTGRQVNFEEYYAPLDRWFEVRASPDPDGLSVFFHDISSRKAAEAQREQAAARLGLLADTARAVVGRLDAEDVAAQLLDVLVPRAADAGLVLLADEGGRVAAGDVEVRGAGPLAGALHALAETLFQTAAEADGGSRAVLLGGLPDREIEVALEAAGAGSGLLAPLRAGDRLRGVLVLARAAAHAYGPDDLEVAGDVAQRVALALENAALYAQQRGAAEVLQRSLLTPLPEPDHLQLTARYKPAAQEAQVGGDWYDAFLQPDGATVLVIGDVMGHDMGAAAAMGQLRNLLRGTAYDRQEPPARVLRRLDAAIRGLEVDTLASALVVRVERDERREGGRRLRWSSAGHPPPMLVRPDGSVQVLGEGRSDLLLGLDPGSERTDREVDVPEGSTLVLYTDGLVERRDSDLSDGLDRLQQLLAEVCHLPLEELCTLLLRRLLPQEQDDDVAVVAVRFHPEDRPRPDEAGPRRAPVDLPVGPP